MALRFLALLSLFLGLGFAIPVEEHSKRQDATFDYVIVGGGVRSLNFQ